MRTQRRRLQFHEPSLVPMADMLTNTVGVALFILIFTVLTAGDAVLTKRLPMRRPTKAEAMHFLCAFGRIAPLDVQPSIEEFFQPLGRTIDLSDLEAFVERFRSRRLENEKFILTGEVGNGLVVAILPKPSFGETATDLVAESSRYRSLLAAANPAERFPKFHVYPDSITTFRAARDIAANAKFGTGWILYGINEPIRTCVALCPDGGDRNCPDGKCTD